MKTEKKLLLVEIFTRFCEIEHIETWTPFKENNGSDEHKPAPT